jgi:hypothetical protein
MGLGSGCPHGNGDPSRCSQCVGALVRQVTVTGGHVLIDGTAIASTADQQRDAEAALVRVPRRRKRRAR